MTKSGKKGRIWFYSCFYPQTLRESVSSMFGISFRALLFHYIYFTFRENKELDPVPELSKYDVCLGDSIRWGLKCRLEIFQYFKTFLEFFLLYCFACSIFFSVRSDLVIPASPQHLSGFCDHPQPHAMDERWAGKSNITHEDFCPFVLHSFVCYAHANPPPWFLKRCGLESSVSKINLLDW